MDPTKEQCPGAEAEALHEIQGGESSPNSVEPDIDFRCRRCGRVLHSEKAIRARVGWRCRLRLVAEGGGADE